MDSVATQRIGFPELFRLQLERSKTDTVYTGANNQIGSHCTRCGHYQRVDLVPSKKGRFHYPDPATRCESCSVTGSFYN